MEVPDAGLVVDPEHAVFVGNAGFVAVVGAVLGDDHRDAAEVVLADVVKGVVNRLRVEFLPVVHEVPAAEFNCLLDGGRFRAVDDPVVAVEAEEIEGFGNALHVAGADVGHAAGLFHVFKERVRVAALEDRVHVGTVGLLVLELRDPQVVGVAGPRGVVVPDVDDETDVRVREVEGLLFAENVAESPDAFSVGEQQVVVGLPAEFLKPAAGREGAEGVPDVGRDGFVERDPQRNFILERLEKKRRVLAVPVHDVAVQEAPAFLQRLRKVPVVERGVGRETQFQHQVHGAAVEIQTLLVDPAGAVGKNSRPREREPVGVEAQFPHHRQLFTVLVVVVAGEVGRLAAESPSGGA